MGDLPTRRDVLSYLMGAGIVAGFGLAGSFGFRFVVPSDAKEKPVEVLIRNVDQLPEGSFYEFRDFQGKKTLLVNRKGTIRAFSSVCPHLGCGVRWEPEKDRFLCPCHIGVFDPSGQVISGPPTAPLAEYAVKIEQGHIYVTLMGA